MNFWKLKACFVQYFFAVQFRPFWGPKLGVILAIFGHFYKTGHRGHFIRDIDCAYKSLRKCPLAARGPRWLTRSKLRDKSTVFWKPHFRVACLASSMNSKSKVGNSWGCCRLLADCCWKAAWFNQPIDNRIGTSLVDLRGKWMKIPSWNRILRNVLPIELNLYILITTFPDSHCHQIKSRN